MHYVGLSRVRNSSALHILTLNVNKIKVTEKVKSEMSRLRTQASLVPLAVLQTDNSLQTKTIFKKPMSTILLNQNYACQIETIHISLMNLLFTEMTSVSDFNVRNCYGTAVYIKNDLNGSKIPYRCNLNNLEITGMVFSQPIPNIHVIGIYRSKTKVAISVLIDALTHLHNSVLMEPTIPIALLGPNAGKYMYRTKSSYKISCDRQKIHSVD